MSRKKEDFEAFLNRPGSLSNREFHEQTKEWIEFVKENPKKYGLLGKGWSKARKRIERDWNRRGDIREEFDELNFLLEQTEKMDDATRLEIYQRWQDFMKTYRLEFEFSDETIADSEDRLAKYRKSLEASRIAEIKLQIARGKAENSVNVFADSMFKASDHLGKPVVMTALKAPKRNQGN